MKLKKSKLTKSQLFALSLSSIYFDSDLKYHYELSGCKVGFFKRSSTRHSLRIDWAIENKNDLRNILDWLLKEGMRKEFNEIRNILKGLSEEDRQTYIKSHIKETKNWCKEATVDYYLNRLTPSGILAYDYGCYSYLCRCAFNVGYISEAEAWELLKVIPSIVQESYISWIDYINACLIGFEFLTQSQPYEFIKKNMPFINKMLVSKKSIINTLDWNTDLYTN